MFRVLFFLFVLIPIIEISVLIHVGEILGAGPTIAIVIITAWLGAKNVKQQGVATLSSVQTKIAQGQMPSDDIVTGLILLFAGVLLVTPGFVTDIFGLSLLIPAFRAILVAGAKKHISTSTQFTSSQFHHQQMNEGFQQEFTDINSTNESKPSGKTLDGEFERKD